MAEIIAKLDPKNGVISITKGSIVGVIDIENKRFYLTDGDKTIDAKLADLGTGETASFRDTTICIEGVEYTAKFLRTAEVAA